MGPKTDKFVAKAVKLVRHVALMCSPTCNPRADTTTCQQKVHHHRYLCHSQMVDLKRLRCERELAGSASPSHSTEPDALVVSSPPTKRSRLLCERFDAKQLERISRCLGMPVDRVEDFFTRNRRTLLAHMPPPGTSSGVLRAASLAWAIKRLCAAERRKACS